VRRIRGDTHGTGTLEPLPDGTFRVHTTTGTPAADGIRQFARLIDGHLQVIGGYGPNEFDVGATGS